MRSIPLLLILVSLISKIRSEEAKGNRIEESEVKYAGPIVYSDEKPPIIYFPTPPTTSSTQSKLNAQNISLNSNNIEYVPFPYQELPVLIYKSKEQPPLHVVSEDKRTDGSNNSLSNIDKRLGDIETTGNQRGGRALKWSNFKLFNDVPLVMKAPKWTNTGSNGFNMMSGHYMDMNNHSLMSSANNPLSLANAPHVVYSGHPPIHVFPQPIIIKEPDFAEMASASEPFHSFKTSQSASNTDPPMSTSNKHEINSNPPSSQFYSYGGAPPGSGNAKSYGFRVKTKGNKQDTDYSSSQTYDNYEDSYSPQHSDGSSDIQLEDQKTRYRPASHYSNSISSDGEHYDKDYDRPVDTYSRDRGREKYPKYSANNWMDWEADNGWLSSLLGANRWPTRTRRPVTLSLVNSPTNEHLLYASSPANQMEMENLAVQMNPHLRHNGWVTGINTMRPTASAIRPVYSLNGLFGYRRPQIPALQTVPHPSPYYARYNPGLTHPSANVGPISALKQYAFGPPIMGLPSVSYPVRIPYSPYMMYGYRRPPLGPPSGDLAFAESTRNTSNVSPSKWVNVKEDNQMSGSHVKPTFALPSAKPSSASAQNKPPIIIYQGLRPPVHVYKQPNLTTRHSSADSSQNAMISAMIELNELKSQIHDNKVEPTTTTTTSTQSPYYQFFSTEETNDYYDKNFKTNSGLYFNDNSAFSPRHSSDNWIPVPQTSNNSKDSDKKA